MRKQKGMSLIETMISLFILGFGLLATTKMQVNMSVADQLARQRTEATQLARNKIEELRGAPPVAQVCAEADISTDTIEVVGCETTEQVDTRDVVNGINLASTKFYRSWTVDTAVTPPLVTVKVTWEDLRKVDATQTARDNKIELTTSL